MFFLYVIMATGNALAIGAALTLVILVGGAISGGNFNPAVSVMMAAADGTVDEDERDALEDISEHLGLKEEAVEQLLNWTVKGYKWMKEGYELLDTLEE